MKFFLSFTVIILLCAYIPSQPALKGNWSGKDSKGETVSFSFLTESTVQVTINNAPHQLMNYTADFSKKPALLDITRSEGGKSAALQCLIDLSEPGILKIQMFLKGGRTPDFSAETEKNPIIFLKKK